MDISDLQLRVQRWVYSTLGHESLHNGKERALRLSEEALELAQALEVPAETLHKLVDYVYSRPVGEVAQELGGCAVTLLAASTAAGVNLAEALTTELDRIETPEVRERVRLRQAEKREALMTDEGNPEAL